MEKPKQVQDIRLFCECDWCDI